MCVPTPKLNQLLRTPLSCLRVPAKEKWLKIPIVPIIALYVHQSGFKTDRFSLRQQFSGYKNKYQCGSHYQ